MILFQDEFYISHPTVFDIKNVYAHQNDPLKDPLKQNTLFTLTTFLDTLAKVILLPDHMQAGYDKAVVATLEPKFDEREALRLFIKQLSTHTLANRCGVITRYLSDIRLLEEHGPMITAAIPMRTKEVPKLIRPKPGVSLPSGTGRRAVGLQQPQNSDIYYHDKSTTNA